MLRRRRHAAVLAVAVAIIAAGVGAQRADAAHAKARTLNCWSSMGNPYRVGTDVVADATWQCSDGFAQQMTTMISLTSPNGTRHTNTVTCYNTTYCSVSVSTPWVNEGDWTWTARADYLYVVDNSGSSYWTGASHTAYITPS